MAKSVACINISPNLAIQACTLRRPPFHLQPARYIPHEIDRQRMNQGVQCEHSLVDILYDVCMNVSMV